MKPFACLIAAVVAVSPLAARAENTYRSGTLENGLRYHLLHTPSEPERIEVRLQVEVGASDENQGEEGVAHMVEHMVFRSAPAYPQGVGDTLAARGWRRGAHFNAMTNYERTLYMFSPPRGKAQLEDTLQALAAMVSPHSFSDADWARERQVIIAEWRNGQGLNERMNRLRTAVIRSGSRQARYAIIGGIDSIRSMQAGTLEQFHRRWYTANNMQIIIAGNIPPAEAEQAVRRHFGRLQPAGLPDRGGNYYEPVLQNGWHVAQLQDKDSGHSTIALIFRADDSPSRNYADRSGTRERLIDRFAARILTDRLKNEQSRLPRSVANVTLRKADIGRHTVAVGLFASVAPDGHNTGLNELLKLREQMLRHPVSNAEFADYRARLLQTVREAEGKTSLPEPFGDALRTVSDAVLAGKPVRTQAENAAIVRPLLDTLTADDITRRLQQWLNAADRLVQIQAPGLTPVRLPESTDIERRARELARSPVPPLQAKTAPAAGRFADAGKGGSIRSEQYDAEHRLTRWTLSNGDTVLLLQNPVAGEKIYLHSIGGSGFMSAGLNPWLSQLAAQIVWQSAPQGWDGGALETWKREHQISLSHSLAAAHAKTEGNAPAAEAENLLHLYRAALTTPQVGGDFREPIVRMMRQQAVDDSSERGARERLTTEFRFGRRAYPRPNSTELEAVDEAALLQQWQAAHRAPATHYILSKLPPAELKPLVERYLAAIPRNDRASAAAPYRPLPGAEVRHAAIGGEERSDVAAWSFAAQPWQPQQALRVSLLQELASGYLKNELRDRALGIYSLRFTSTLDPDAGRINSELRFSSAPERADDLWRLAERVLATLPERISEADVRRLRDKLVREESERLKRPETWLNRLILSEQHYGDARYLSSMRQLPDAITLPQMRSTARLLWQPQNRRVLVIDPQTGR